VGPLGYGSRARATSTYGGRRAASLEDQHLGPPLLDAGSLVNVSSSSSESSATFDTLSVAGPSCGPLDQAQSALAEQQIDQVSLPLGEGLLNILQAYSSQDDSLPNITEEVAAGSSMLALSSQLLTSADDDLFLPSNVNLASPNEAHLQLTLGRVQTYFSPVPEEHDLSKKVSVEGMALWEKYFAPKSSGLANNDSISLVDIPASWFNFITLMLLTPEKFDWAKGFLSSQLWDIMKEPMHKEETVKFAIPDKCVTSQAPSCFSLTELVDEPLVPSEDSLNTPKRKRRDSKIALVETEVRRSPRLILLNDGYKNHDNCSDKYCLTCNVAPPIINTKVAKNLAISFFKVL
jgi:hypothetical protein